MILKIIMHRDISDYSWDSHDTPVYSDCYGVKVAKVLEQLEAESSENDYYYLVEVDLE